MRAEKTASLSESVSDAEASMHSKRAPYRSGGRGAIPLTVGSLVSGLAAFIVIALGTRAVGAAAFAPVSVLWSLWALSAAAVSFPLQHWTIRSAELAGEGALAPTLRRVVPLIAATAVVTAGGCLLLGSRLYATAPVHFSMMTGLLPIGSAVVGIQRGLLAHRRRYHAVALSFAGENVVRAFVAGAILLGHPSPNTGATMLGWGIVAGFGVAAGARSAIWPTRSSNRAGPVPSLRLLSGFAGANVSAQATLTAGPVLLSLLAAPEVVVTQMFTVLALIRVPYTGLTGASAAISGPLTRIARDAPARLRAYELRGAVVLAMMAVAAALVAPIVLPPLTSALFATTLTIPRVAQSILLAAGTVAIGGLVEMLVLLGVGHPRRLLASWGTALVVGLACLALPGLAVTRVAVGFMAAMSVAFMAMVMRGATPAPGIELGDS